jgi:PKD repeat protein
MSILGNILARPIVILGLLALSAGLLGPVPVAAQAPCADGGVSESERQALLALYDATSGPGWANNGGSEGNTWAGPPGTECCWHGVSCAEGPGDGVVVELILPQNELDGTLPNQIGDLESLGYLDLSGNRLDGPIPSQIGGLVDLGFLNLASNTLRGLVPETFMGLQQADGIGLEHNALYTDNPDLEAFLDQAAPSGSFTDTQTVAPVGVEVTAIGTTSVSLSWEQVDFIAQPGRYEVYYALAPSGTFALGATTADKETTSATVGGLAEGTTYDFVVKTRTDPHVDNQNSVLSDASVVLTATTDAPPEPPVIEVTGPSSGLVGDALIFAAAAENCAPDPEGWSWSVDGGEISGPATTASVTVAWATPGLKTVSATNAQCGSASGSHSVEIDEESPAPVITLTGPSSGLVGDALTFTASAESCTPDPEGWSWSVDGGEISGPATTASVTVVWATPGLKTVGATNAQCGSASGSHTVEIDEESPAPVITLTGPSSGLVGEALTFTASAESCTPASTGWGWNTGGGTISGPPNASSVVVTWATPGSKTVTVTNTGCPGAFASLVVEIGVEELPPVISISGPSSGLVGDVLTFTATAESCTPAAMGWVWGTDGGAVSGPLGGSSVAISWATPGTKTVTVTNSACPGASGSHSVEISPTEEPVVCALSDHGASSSLALVGGRLNGVDLTPNQRVLSVAPQAMISGVLEVEATSTYPADRALRLGWTPTWGPPPTSWADAGSLPTPVSGRAIELPVRLTAPSTPGTHHLVVAFGPEQTAAQLLSATSHLAHGGVAVWGNGDDVAEWDATTLSTAASEGTVCVAYLPEARYVPATTVTVVVQDVPAAPPAADFAWSPAAPRAGERVRFVDLSTGAVQSRWWDFGDGAGSAAARPLHLFSAPGTYPVELFVSGPAGQSSRVHEIVVAAADAAVIVAGPSEVTAGELATFVASPVGCAPGASDWVWSAAGGAIEGPASADAATLVWETPGLKRIRASHPSCGSSNAGSHTLEVVPLAAPGPAPAPEVVSAVARSSTSVEVSWMNPTPRSDLPGGAATAFQVEAKLGDRPFDEVALVPVEARSTIVEGLPSDLDLAFQVKTVNAAGLSAASGQANATTPAGSCVESIHTLCLNDDRFQVEVVWQVLSGDFAGETGFGRAVALSEDTGYFWFFNPENVELILKVLDGRALTGHFWVFYGALSTVEYRISVKDTVTGRSRFYTNPWGNLASVADVEALAPLSATWPVVGAAPVWALDAHAFGLNSETAVSTSVVAPRTLAELDFTWQPQVLLANQPVKLHDSATGLVLRTWTIQRLDTPAEPVLYSTPNPTLDHTFSSPGTYEVSLKAVQIPSLDKQGVTVSHVLEVAWAPSLPQPSTIVVTAPFAVPAGADVVFSAKAVGCITAPQGWSWQVSPGAVIKTPQENRNGASLRVAWPSSGIGTVTATNSACGGAQGVATISIEDPAPVIPEIALEGPGSGPAGEPLSFNAVAAGCTPHPDGWSWQTAGAAGAGSHGSASLIWESEGTRQVVVTNANCGAAQAVKTVAIEPQPPPPPTPPQAPSDLVARVLAGNEVELTWKDNSDNEAAFRVQVREGQTGLFEDVALMPANHDSVVVDQLAAATAFTFRVRAENEHGASEFVEASATMPEAICAAGDTSLCLNHERFRVEVTWNVPWDTEGFGEGVGQALPLTRDTGYFWFFHPDNVEILLKVLDGRAINGRFWVFYGALSSVEYTITVTDTITGKRREYVNEAGALASVADTSAF